MQRFHRRFPIDCALPLSSFLLGSLISAQPGLGQIQPDRTLGNERSVVERNRIIRDRSADVITGGAIRGRNNLFHSFREFNVNQGQRVYFANPAGIDNIFTRITGNNPSRIRGLLGVDGLANLFLLNPHGILFGPSSSLDIRGSFLATTADSIIFDKDIQFRSDGTQTDTLLRVSVPIGLQFGANPGAIVNLSAHQLPDEQIGPPFSSDDPYVGLNLPVGQTLALVGGDITLNESDLTVPNGRIELGAVASADRVQLTQIPQGWKLTYGDVQRFGNIQLSNISDVDASGIGGGSIQIQADRIRLSNSTIRTNTLGADQGGNLIIRANQIVVRDSGQIIVNATSIGNGGDLQIRATDFIHLIGAAFDGESVNPSGLFVRSALGAEGKSGNISIATGELQIQDGAQISTRTQASGNPAGVANTGRITIRASEIEMSGVTLVRGEPLLDPYGATVPSSISTFTDSNRRAGNLTITTDRLQLRDGATLQTSTLGSGRAGNLTIRATDSIEVTGTASGTTVPTGLVSFSGGIAGTEIGPEPEPDATGRGGRLEITTQKLTVRDGAVVAVGSSNPTDNDGISGNLRVQTETLKLDDRALLTAATESVDGGNIRLQVGHLLTLQRNSTISASAGNDRTGGDGGNINANADFIFAAPSQNSDIIANAFEGAGGNITLSAESILGLAERKATLDNQTNDIDASSEFGTPGTVIINSPNLDFRQDAISLPVQPVRSYLAQGCQIEGGSTPAAFFNTGRSGLPISPYEPISETDILADLRSPHLPSNYPLTEATGWRETAGQIILVSESPTQSNHCQFRELD